MSARSTLLVAAVLLVTACSSRATQMIVTVDAEPGVRMDSARLHVVVLGGVGRTTPPTASRFDRVLTPGDADPPYPITLGLAPLDGDVGRSYSVTATAETATGGFVGQVRIIGGYVDGETMTVRLVLEDTCRAVVCGPEQTCRGGACVAARAGGGADGGTGANCTPASGCPLGCSTIAPTRCAEFLPSNVDPALFVAGTDVVLPGAIDTTSCSLPAAMVAVQFGGPEACVVRGRDITAPLGTTVRVSGTRPLVLLASRDILVAGDIDASARGATSGAGATTTGVTVGGNGAHLQYMDGGGGGGALCGAGGAGGRGSNVGTAEAAGGTAGTPLSATELEPMRGGSPGGRGNHGADAAPLGAGGGGGGGLQLSARGTITLRGTLSVGGGGGQRGRAYDPSIDYGAGGGGGSGGAVLIEAPTVIYDPTARVQAIGGGGGSSGGSNGSAPAVEGTDGQDGVAATDRAAGGANAATSFAANGGRSGGGSAAAGEVGGSNTTSASANGGGGGGGVGCVVVRTASGALPMNATLSAPGTEPALRALRVRAD